MQEDRINLYYVNENPILIQRKCKEFGAATIGKFAVGMLIIALMYNWIPDIITVYYPISYWDLFADKLKLTPEMVQQLPSIPVAALGYSFVFNGVFQLGRALYALTYIRNNRAEYAAIFEGFKLFLKAFPMFIVQTLIISLWSMLFVIPGIFAYYNFKQAYFILADNPEKSIFECLAESKIRMRGNRFNLFRLQITYLPVIILSYLPVLVVDYFANLDLNTITGTLIFIGCNIPVTLALSLLLMGEAVFYELLIQGGFSNFKYSAQAAFRNNTAAEQQ